MHALRSFFTIDELSPVRRIGLAIDNRSWMVKDMFLQRAAGTGRNAPALATGETLRGLMHPSASS
jgi:hypothetical protein